MTLTASNQHADSGATYQHLEIVRLEENFLKLVLNMHGKSVNVLSSELVTELMDCIPALKKDESIQGLLITSGKPKQFIAGANIEEIFDLKDAKEASEKARYGQQMMDLIENLPFPTVSVIDGPTLGGGLEFALSTTYRVAS
ncbi:MAG: enoyl-CoA hydratase/isomerase family protein, partial [Bdellovibrionales bacterium]|nr:enoyl-CoA hydratase/isomerase family protein [Bdellovibrionales bacterium]